MSSKLSTTLSPLQMYADSFGAKVYICMERVWRRDDGSRTQNLWIREIRFSVLHSYSTHALLSLQRIVSRLVLASTYHYIYMRTFACEPNICTPADPTLIIRHVHLSFSALRCPSLYPLKPRNCALYRRDEKHTNIRNCVYSFILIIVALILFYPITSEWFSIRNVCNIVGLLYMEGLYR